MYGTVKKIHGTRYDKNHLKTFCEVLLKGNRLTEETESRLHELVNCGGWGNFNFLVDRKRSSVILLSKFYLKIKQSLPEGNESTLIQDNMEVCKMYFGLPCEVSPIDCIDGLLKIKPYFKNNTDVFFQMP